VSVFESRSALALMLFFGLNFDGVDQTEITLFNFYQINVFVEADPEDVMSSVFEGRYIKMEAEVLESPLSHQYIVNYVDATKSS
jgi:hypothetical protein